MYVHVYVYIYICIYIYRAVKSDHHHIRNYIFTFVILLTWLDVYLVPVGFAWTIGDQDYDSVSRFMELLTLNTNWIIRSLKIRRFRWKY